MNIKASLRFLAIAGAFLSAKSALAHNSFSAIQTLGVRDTLKTQISGGSNALNDTAVDLPAPQANEIDRDGNSQQSAANVTTTRDRFSNDAIEPPTQVNVFASDVATIDGNMQLSSVPDPVETPELSVTIPVPPPLTQIIKVQPVKKFPRVVKTNTSSVVSSSTPTPRTGVRPESESSTPTLAPRTTVIPVVTLPPNTPATFTNPVPQSPTAIATSPDAAIVNSDIIYPLMRPAPITSRYGWRTHPLTGTRRFHSGIDIAAATGTPVVATESGTVISAGWNSGYGKAIVIQHGDSQQTLYGHLSEISVVAGQTLVQGTVIGKVGSTGNSTGPHLHFERRVPNPDGWVAVDPGQEIQYAVDNLRRSMPFAQKDLPQGL